MSKATILLHICIFQII